MYKKLQKATADLGTDAVIVSGQSQSLASAPGVLSTVVTETPPLLKGALCVFVSEEPGLSHQIHPILRTLSAPANLLAGRYTNGDDVFFADYQPGDFPDDFRILPGASDQLIDEIVDAGVRRDEPLANGTMLHFSFAEN